jgi:hypothetical protein
MVGAGLDGASRVGATNWWEALSHGEDLQLAALFTRSQVQIKTRLEWTGDIGSTDVITHGNESVANLDVDDFHQGVGADVRPGPSFALDASAKLRSGEMLGYFVPSQGSGYADYRFTGPGQAGHDGAFVGSSDETFLYHGDQAGTWRFNLQAVFASNRDLRPVVLAGDLSGGIEEMG